MAIIQKEYLFSINEFKEPSKVVNRDAIALLLVRLIMMKPGTNPLHPDMGVGITNYRYGLNNVSDLKRRVEDQIETYLPDFQNATVEIKVTEDKMCNIEISIDDVVYIYDSSTAPIPITLSDIQNG